MEMREELRYFLVEGGTFGGERKRKRERDSRQIDSKTVIIRKRMTSIQVTPR